MKKKEMKIKRLVNMQIGLVVALSLVVSAFEYKSIESDYLSSIDTDYQKLEQKFTEDLNIIYEEKEEEVLQLAIQPKVQNLDFLRKIDVNELDVEDEKFLVIDTDPIIEDLTSNFGTSFTADPTVHTGLTVQKTPEFPGGEKALMKFLADNLYYTKAAREARKQGRMTVQFIVRKNGNCEIVSISNNLGYGLDDVTKEAFSKMPKWKPAEKDGLEVNCYFHLPVVFKLD